MRKKDNAKVEQENGISISVFRYKNKKPYCICTSKQIFGKNLLLTSHIGNSHNLLIQDFNRCITDKTKHPCKKHFCQYCLQCLSTSKILKYIHKKFC